MSFFSFLRRPAVLFPSSGDEILGIASGTPQDTARECRVKMAMSRSTAVRALVIDWSRPQYARVVGARERVVVVGGARVRGIEYARVSARDGATRHRAVRIARAHEPAPPGAFVCARSRIANKRHM